MEELKGWYLKFPIFSRCFLTAVIFVTVVSSTVYPDILYYIYLDLEKLKYFQIWRIFTNFFFIGKFGPNILWDVIFLYFSITRLQSIFSERQLDEQLWLSLFNMVLLSVIGLIFKEVFLCHSLLFSFLYIWCKRRPFEEISFFGLSLKSGYFPFVLMLFHLITGQSIYRDLYGMAVGHIYIFLKDIYPVSSNNHFLRTPLSFSKVVNKYLNPAIQNNFNGNNDNG